MKDTAARLREAVSRADVLRYVAHSVAIIVLLHAAPARAQFTKSGAIVCNSLKTYRGQEFENFSNLYDSMLAKRECTTLPANLPVRVVSREGKYVGFKLLSGDVEATFWGVSTAIVRRKQPEVGSIILSGPSDTSGLCGMLSLETRSYNKPSLELAKDILHLHNPAKRAQGAFIRAIVAHDYELVVHMAGVRCVAELDVADEDLLGCYIDATAFYNCRQISNGKLQQSDCYQSLCRAKAAVVRPDPAVEMQQTLSDSRVNQRASESQRRREVQATREAVDRYAFRNFGKQKAPTNAAACSNLSNQVGADQILARHLAGAVTSVYERGEYGGFQEFNGPTARAYEDTIVADEFSLKLQYEEGDCRAVLRARSGLNLPTLACVVRVDEVQRCLNLPVGRQTPFNLSMGMCLMNVCIK